jgi:hypothetical protein
MHFAAAAQVLLRVGMQLSAISVSFQFVPAATNRFGLHDALKAES